MKNLKRPIIKIRLLIYTMAIGGIVWAYIPAAWGFESSGMSLDIFVAGGQEDLHYILNDPDDPVTLIVVLCNESGKSIDTEKGFSQINLHHAVIVTDMNRDPAVRYFLRPSHRTHKMPEPYALDERLWSLAEKVPAKLPSGGKYCTSATIDDLRAFVPEMFKTPGLYNVSARLPFIRFAVTGFEPGLGFIGQLENEKNWDRGIASKKSLDIFIDPPAGAQFKVQVLDKSTDPAQKPFQVPVKAFKTEAVKGYASLEEAWTREKPLIEKKTDTNGQVILAYNSGCLSQDDYTIIAHYSDKFKESLVTASESGWVTGSCAGQIVKEITFIGIPPAVPGDLDGNGSVEQADYLIFRAAYGSCTGDSNFNPAADFDSDDCITMNDYRLFRSYAQQQR